LEELITGYTDGVAQEEKIKALKPVKTKKGPGNPKVRRDWIRELMVRTGEGYHHDAHEFWRPIDQWKVIHVGSDGGANQNPGSAG
jgi:hypothetical protein